MQEELWTTTILFFEKHTGLNSKKWHYLWIYKDTANKLIKLGNKVLHAETEKKLFGSKVDKDLHLQSHTKFIVKTANQKLSSIIRVTPCVINFNETVVFNSFNEELFSYFSLLWMFSTKTVNRKTSRLHERGLRELLNDENSRHLKTCCLDWILQMSSYCLSSNNKWNLHKESS